MDWLLERQPAIETALAKRHLTNGTLVLYDVSSSYMEGRCCPLAKRGYSRDGRRGTLQIIYGLLCAADGCPVAIEVFDGNTADPMTLATQVEKLKQRFHLDHVVLVGDRGMVTQARITDDIKAAGLDWITALRAPAIKALLETGALQLSLFDQRDMASITAPDFPGERLVVCRNPDLAAERTRKRQDLLAATERDLGRIQAAVARKRDPLRGIAEIALAVGAVLDKHKMAKHFDLAITDAAFSFARKATEIAAEAANDGIYVVRTSLPAEALDDAAVVRSYKSLSLVERAFRCIKTVDLQVRPVHHWLADRVRAHVCLCMLAYYLEWHMRQRLAPMLFDDTDKQAAEAPRASVVAQAQRSPAAVTKQTTGFTEHGFPLFARRSRVEQLGDRVVRDPDGLGELVDAPDQRLLAHLEAVEPGLQLVVFHHASPRPAGAEAGRVGCGDFSPDRVARAAVQATAPDHRRFAQLRRCPACRPAGSSAPDESLSQQSRRKLASTDATARAADAAL
ncbi:MAG: IS1634 family transposase [Alphaproteobacteria bacterium]|nr:IS1634 family transposase [Alphaproteobacteria bacterium]